MSFMVLHMDKFKKDAIRGIQSHNRRERESHSNPDIDYDRSAGNYDLCANTSSNYAEAIQNRIDDLLMVKAVRKDAVHLCGLIVSSDKDFFGKLNADETRHFFTEATNYLTEFVGKENVISAMVHMDEKTPHMHFLHVPVTKDGRLCAKDIYTKAALKKLQDELPKHLQKCGFQIERGVERQKGSAKKHLDTNEYKQQQEMLKFLQTEAENLRQTIKNMETRIAKQEQTEAEIEERIAKQKVIVAEAEEKLRVKSTLPPANIFNYKAVLSEAEQVIATFQQALADKDAVARERDARVYQAENLLRDRDDARKMANKAIAVVNAERKNFENSLRKLKEENQSMVGELDSLRSFILLNGFVEAYGNFQRERKAQQSAADEAGIRQQPQMANSSGRQRMR